MSLSQYPFGRDARAHQIRTEHKELQAVAEGLRERAISARALLIEGPTVEKILAEAERVQADAIIIGSHGYGASYRALLGSVNEGVLRGARCPVLVVPADPSKDSMLQELNSSMISSC